MDCVYCGEEIISEPTDTTYSNYNSHRTKMGQHTGNIYTCDACGGLVLDDLLNGVVREWKY